MRGGQHAPAATSAPETAPAAAKPYKPGMKAIGDEHASAQKKAWRATAPQTVEDLMKVSAANQAALAKVCNPAAASVGIEFADPGVKSEEGVRRKVGDGKAPNSICDAVRGGFSVNSPEDGDKIIRALAKHFEIADEGWTKNDAGYFDRKTMVRFPDGQVGEIQMWLPGMFHAKEFGGGHKMYEEQRVLKKDDPKFEELNVKMRDLYAGVQQKLSNKWAALFPERR